VSRLLFWNTLGSSAGGFAVGYALIPAVGLAARCARWRRSLGLGLAALFRERREAGARRTFARHCAGARLRRGDRLARARDPVRELIEAVASREGRGGDRGGPRRDGQRIRERRPADWPRQRAPCDGHTRRVSPQVV
jgi:hypothetical protein